VVDACVAAPRWLAAAIERSLTPPGATLSGVFVMRAPELDPAGGPGEAWLAAAAINGAGVRPEAGIWLIDGLDPGSVPSLRAMSVPAQRYSSLPRGDRSRLLGSQTVRVLTGCIGPIPEP